MSKLLHTLYSLIRCPLNHDWRIVKADAATIEQVCRKCGKRIVRAG